MAAQFAEMWEALGRPENFAIVEQGAHGGEFARDVLEAASAHHPEFFATIRYEIVEPFPALKERQLAALATFDSRVTWRDSLDDLPAYRGVHFSNELIDAMPVHLVRWTGENGWNATSPRGTASLRLLMVHYPTTGSPSDCGAYRHRFPCTTRRR
jgi:SAM-dependent MidA family methyltransferase